MIFMGRVVLHCSRTYLIVLGSYPIYNGTYINWTQSIKEQFFITAWYIHCMCTFNTVDTYCCSMSHFHYESLHIRVTTYYRTIWASFHNGLNHAYTLTLQIEHTYDTGGWICEVSLYNVTYHRIHSIVDSVAVSIYSEIPGYRCRYHTPYSYWSCLHRRVDSLVDLKRWWITQTMNRL